MRVVFAKTHIIVNINNGLLRWWRKTYRERRGAGGGCHDAPGRRSHSFLLRPQPPYPFSRGCGCFYGTRCSGIFAENNFWFGEGVGVNEENKPCLDDRSRCRGYADGFRMGGSEGYMNIQQPPKRSPEEMFEEFASGRWLGLPYLIILWFIKSIEALEGLLVKPNSAKKPDDKQ